MYEETIVFFKKNSLVCNCGRKFVWEFLFTLSKQFSRLATFTNIVLHYTSLLFSPGCAPSRRRPPSVGTVGGGVAGAVAVLAGAVHGYETGNGGLQNEENGFFCFVYSPGENGVGLAGKVLEVDYGEQGKDCGEKKQIGLGNYNVFFLKKRSQLTFSLPLCRVFLWSYLVSSFVVDDRSIFNILNLLLVQQPYPPLTPAPPPGLGQSRGEAYLKIRIRILGTS